MGDSSFYVCPDGSIEQGICPELKGFKPATIHDLWSYIQELREENIHLKNVILSEITRQNQELGLYD